MVACSLLDMVYIQNMMEEDRKEGTPGSLQPFSASASSSGLLHHISRLEGNSCGCVGLGGHWEGWRCVSRGKAQMERGARRGMSGQWAGRRQEQPVALPGLAQPWRSPRHSHISHQNPQITPFTKKNRSGEL